MTQAYVVERALDLSPMIDALRFQPSDFELSRGWLVHTPSQHRFRFGTFGRFEIDAHCNCVLLRHRRDQEGDLRSAFDSWRLTYWRAVEINQEFASHFSPVGRFGRFLRDVRVAYRRMRRSEAAPSGYGEAFGVPAE